MSTSRTFHSFHLDISTCDSNRICYIVLPERLKENEKTWLDRMAETLSANMVVVSGLDWETDLTPWKAPGLKAGEFAGKAQAFLDILAGDLVVNVESSLRINKVRRFICGISLSGLFGVWASCRRELFEGVASVSGSFWYDGFDRIYEGTICYCTEIDQTVRNSVILEEIYNGLGPVQDTDLRADSIIYAGYSEPQELTQIDKLLLRLLYHPSMKCGMDREECEAVIRSLYY